MPAASRRPSPLSAAVLGLSALLALAAAPARAGGEADPSQGAGQTPDSAALAAAAEAMSAALDSVERSLAYRTGEIDLGEGLAMARLPAGYRYLDPDQTSKVLTELWGNPPGDPTLGMIFPPGSSPLAEDSWAVILSFEEDGYVKDDDADKIDYDDLLKQMKADSEERNQERAKAGYEPITIIGWAEKPSYDKAANKLYWAKEIRFGQSVENTLNYNIRALGRRGVLVLNAVSSMKVLDQVREGMKAIQPVVEFKDGHRYSEFDPKIDKVATYGLAGLVAGTLLAKGGLLKALIAALIAGKKFIVIGLAALGAGLFKFFKGRSEERKVVTDEAKKVG